MDRGAWREYARSAEEELVRQHLPAARRLARRVAGWDRPELRDDVEQEAALALVEAVRDYDPGRGVPFASYALWRVHCRVVDFLRAHGAEAGRRAAPLGAREDERGTGDEEAGALQDALRRCRDRLAAPGADDEAVRNALLAQLERAVASLPDRDRQILALYWEEGLSLAEIARVLGVSRTRAWELHSRALARLAALMGAGEREEEEP
jgi:RNA polymerase sigma factor for flagellar operon FliA